MIKKKMTESFPKITRVEIQPEYRLLVWFENGVLKLYDCRPLLEQEPFVALSDQNLFKCAYADPHGYGVIWNDSIDLAESEIWLNGKDAEQSHPGDGDDVGSKIHARFRRA